MGGRRSSNVFARYQHECGQPVVLITLCKVFTAAVQRSNGQRDARETAPRCSSERPMWFRLLPKVVVASALVASGADLAAMEMRAPGTWPDKDFSPVMAR